MGSFLALKVSQGNCQSTIGNFNTLVKDSKTLFPSSQSKTPGSKNVRAVSSNVDFSEPVRKAVYSSLLSPSHSATTNPVSIMFLLKDLGFCVLVKTLNVELMHHHCLEAVDQALMTQK